MGEVIGGFLGYALGIAISPIPIAAVILMLFSAQARVNAPIFLAGWVLGIGTVATVALLIPGIDPDANGEPATAAGLIKALLGALLLAAALRQWRTRPAPGEIPPMPKWMAGIDGLRARAAFAMALLLSAVNPKNLVLAAAGGVGIGASEIGTAQTVFSVVVFTALASVSIALPTVGYLIAGDRIEPTLARTKDWMIANNGTVTALLFLVFAVLLLGDALSILTG